MWAEEVLTIRLTFFQATQFLIISLEDARGYHYEGSLHAGVT